MAGNDDIRATVHVHHCHLDAFSSGVCPKRVINDRLELDLPSDQMGGSRG
jgi:hypothetical protein